LVNVYRWSGWTNPNYSAYFITIGLPMRIGLAYSEQLSLLEDDWDSYGAKKPTDEARSTLSALSAVPVSDGGIQIELRGGGCDLEIEISPTGEIKSLFMEPIGRTTA
jgi:hypothetical protein